MVVVVGGGGHAPGGSAFTRRKLTFWDCSFFIAALAASGNDELDEPTAGKRMKIVSSGGLSEHDMTFRLRPTAVLDLPDVPGNDPTVEGATLVVTDTGDPTRTRTVALPASGWRRFGLAPNFRFVYRGQVTPEEPCVSLRITQRRITGHGGATQKAAGQAVLGPPFVGAASLVLTVGADSKRYCALFGGTTIRG